MEAWQATLLAGLIAALVLYHIHRLNNRRTACGNFRHAFADALARIEAAHLHNSPDDRPDVDQLLRDHFERHAAAVHEFRPFLRRRQRKLFDRAWKQYAAWVGPANSYPTFMAEAESDGDPYPLLLERVRAILAFAPDT